MAISETDTQARYEQAVTQVLRTGASLNSPRANLLPEAEWQRHFGAYTERLAEVRRLGDELRLTRPPLQPRLSDADIAEVMELFAE